MSYANCGYDKFHPESYKCEWSRGNHLWVIGSGKDAIVVESENPGAVIKATSCVESIEMLRRLNKHPIAGLPEVLNEICSQPIEQFLHKKSPQRNFVCFELAKYEKPINTINTPDELQFVQKIIEKYALEKSDKESINILEDGVNKLSQNGFIRFAGALEFLILFLNERPNAFLDAAPENFMINAQGFTVYVDPVRSSRTISHKAH